MGNPTHKADESSTVFKKHCSQADVVTMDLRRMSAYLRQQVNSPLRVCAACGDTYRLNRVEHPTLCGPCALLAEVTGATISVPGTVASLFKPETQ